MAAIACVVMRHRKKNPSKTAGPSRASHARKARASYEQMLKDDQARCVCLLLLPPRDTPDTDFLTLLGDRMLLQTHDKSHTGKLNREELGALLTVPLSPLQPSRPSSYSVVLPASCAYVKMIAGVNVCVYV